MRNLFGISTAFLFLHMVMPADVVAEERGAKVDGIEPSGIAVSISVEQKLLEQRLRVLVSFRFENMTKESQRLEKWLALQPAEVTLAVLRVLDSKRGAIRYIGPHVHRMEPTAEDFLVLRPGESRSVPDVDVTDRYAWPGEAQKITIWFEALSYSRRKLELLQSKRIEFDYRPVVPRPGVPRGKLMKKSHPATKGKGDSGRI